MQKSDQIFCTESSINGVHVLIFHTRKAVSTGLVEGNDPTDSQAKYELSIQRIALGLVVLALVGALMLACVKLEYQAGATAMLHLLEVIAGGMAGLLFGEKSGIEGKS